MFLSPEQMESEFLQKAQEYTKELLKEHDMENCKPILTSLDAGGVYRRLLPRSSPK